MLVLVGADLVRVAAATTKTIPIVAIDMETDPVQNGPGCQLCPAWRQCDGPPLGPALVSYQMD